MHANPSRNRRAHRRVLTGCLATVLILTSGLSAAPPVQATHQELTWDEDGSTFTTFGANAAVTISLGFIEMACDSFFPLADIYILDAPPAPGAALVDIGGVENTVFGASGGLFSDTIGYTMPGGLLGPGTYTVVYDECQNGTYDAAVDAVFPDAFEVVLPAEVPALAPAIAAVKGHAGVQALQWQDTLNAYEGLLNLDKIEIVLECLTFNVGACVYAFVSDVAVNGVDDRVPGFLGTSPQERVKLYGKAVAKSMFRHWDAINADPPDPDFRQITVLAPIELFEPAGDALDRAEIRFGQAAAIEGVLAEALLHAMERYQGADLEGDGTWALVHARAIRRFATLLAQQLPRTNAALAELRATVAADPRDLDAVAAFASAERDRILADGLSDAELARIASLGIPPAEVEATLEAIAGFDPAVNARASMDAAFAGQMAANSDAMPGLLGLATTMDDTIAGLEADPAVSDDRPTADAGGPYTTQIGGSLGLDAGASHDPDGILVATEWDLDGDGAFDDATGPSPAAAAQVQGDGMVGVRVRDDDGNVGVDYALIATSNPNRPPALVTSVPAGSTPAVEIGATIGFGATATDGDGDLLTLSWELDGVPVATGDAYTFAATPDRVGSHLLEAIVSDGRPGGTIRRTWHPFVVGPDGDGDGWPAPLDCDDAAPAVHPLALEIPGNGIDDDCLIGTVDGGDTSSTLTLPITIRDFLFSHPDFEGPGGDDRGIVTTTIGSDRKPVYASAGTTPTTSGRANFDQWYRDVAGVNIPIAQDLTFNLRPGTNIYRVERPSFFPINDLGFGNEGQGANYSFTVEGHSSFTYRGGEIFSFTGDDDVWVYINDRLVIDLGGVHPAESASVDLDAVASTIGITVGATYAFDFFSAERHTVGSTLIADTSIKLVDPAGPLAVEVAATPSLERGATWSLDHAVTPARVDLFAGDSADAQFAVTAARSLGALGVSVAGEVCVSNGAAGPTDTLEVRLLVAAPSAPGDDPLASAELDLSATPILAAGGTACYAYDVALDAARVHAGMPLMVTASAATADPAVRGDGIATPDLPFEASGLDETVTVDVTGSDTLVLRADVPARYERTFSCPGDAGARVATATIRGMASAASATVTVACHDLDVSLSTMTLLRTSHAWSVSKTGSTAALTLAPGQRFPVDYVVTVADTMTVEGLARGSLLIRNPAPVPATINALSLVVLGLDADVACGVGLPVELPPGGALACRQEATVPDPAPGSSILDVIVGNRAFDAAGSSTPAGTTIRQASAAVDFGTGSSTEVDACAVVDDTLAGPLGTACSATAPTTYRYTLDLGPFTTSTVVDNVASATAAESGAVTDGRWSVAISLPSGGCTLTIGYWKNHAGGGPQRDMVTARLPISLGTVGGSKSVLVTAVKQAIDLLGMSGDPSNGIKRLQAQLLAARLNVATGASPAAVAAVLASADGFLASHAASGWKQLTKAQQQTVSGWAASLDEFNRGVIGPGHCTE